MTTPSRLATAHSPYLRSAATQPVAWYPWGDEAFQRARSEGKPILLDIGAVWCHWCHVMDHESYENPEVAEELNRDWICIKVDRDERPDVDARYQRAVQALTGQGGWPLTGFLTPDGEVFFGGTYFPPDSRHGRPGFITVLSELAQRYREQPDEIRQQTAELTEHLRVARSDLQSADLDVSLLERTADAMARTFDFRHGGFGTQPKFPHPGACEFILDYYRDTSEPWAAEIVSRTLTGMARGGIRDHVGGGFHRYSVDARWIVPHFEKMLYDNAELLRVYARAAGVPTLPGRDGTLLRNTVTGVVGWVMEVMADPVGGYFGSQDADVGPGDDGDYFTWTPQEVAEALGDEKLARLMTRYYGVTESGDMHHNRQKNVLWTHQTITEVATSLAQDEATISSNIERGRELLLTHRNQRDTPFVDRTLYTAWNAMMVSAMIDAAALLERMDLEEHALRTLERFFAEAAEPDLHGGMGHAVGSTVRGILDDQVHAANASVDAYETTGDSKWLDRATGLMTQVLADYGSASDGLRDALRGPDDGEMLAQELVPIQDAPTPSGNGVAAIVLGRLAMLTGDQEWTRHRDALLEPLAGSIPALGIFGATLARALDWAVNPSTSIVIVGEPSDTRRLRWAARRRRPPRTVMRCVRSDDSPDEFPEPMRAMLDGATPAAYVCVGTRCAPPAHTAEELTGTLEGFNA